MVDAIGDINVKAESLNEIDPLGLWGANLIAPFFALDDAATYTTDTTGGQVFNAGDTVEVKKNYDNGGDAGTHYRYLGTDGAVFDPSEVDYAAGEEAGTWESVNQASETGIGWVRTFTTYLDGNLGLDNNLVDSWSQATATGQKLAIAGAITVLDMNNKADAVIRNGATINHTATQASR